MPNVRANGIDIEYDDFGSPDDPSLLLIMGLTAQMTAWDERFCQQIASAGFHVVRFDNRDVGLSTRITDGPVPDVMCSFAGDHSTASYTLADMAADAAGLLDVLGLAPAHVVGASMGGMIAQELAIGHPDKVRSLCSIMSTTGDRSVGQASAAAVGALMQPPATTPAEAAERSVTGSRIIGSPAYPQDEAHLRARGAAAFERANDPVGGARQLVAIQASPDRTEALRSVRVPTLVVHGEADPLVNVSGGEATAKAIPGAELLVIPGMGHDLPPALWDQIVGAIVANAAKAS